ncbi:methyltransferase domain-containing protein [Flavivirga aquimarina]|uniref:Methyltransferase domain-containing protein n=1 Tax=Flavivirga aquimarina TaxID=2027862 RepID=A0ABT8WGK3_9FLAO|nr:methyltransferase domain-containing protein [Flavivirga aquimarina]MDO5972265.1 methyltransferase domain-containing protein [Flavivirga aquimarina]
MNQKLKTSIAYTKNLFVTGAIAKTSRFAEVGVCKNIPKDDHKTIVEFGVGHGNITQEILNTISATSKLYAFEVNKNFCEHVKKTIQDPRLILINDGAENLGIHVKDSIDAVVSSIPFSFFGKEKGLKIIQNAYDLMSDNCYFSQVLYTKFNFKKFQQIFEDCEITSNKKLITEYVYHCRKVRN